ncbi:MAG: extracellular solute-binding protein, partial [Clostridiales bacterium]|nr:extracellular solute-binding protein [Clostridiales bacterium]
EQVALVLASGDLPDAFWGCGGGISQSILVQYGVDDGTFVALDELIQGAPNIVAAFNDANAWGSITQTDGHIYHIPQINVCQHCRVSAKMWYNGVWAEKLGIAMPTTTDEFYDMLVAFKTQDPNGNGEADEIPLAGSTDGWHANVVEFLMNAFTYMDNDNRGFRITDGAADNSALDPAFRDGIAYLRKLADEGLLYLPSFSQTNDALKKLTEAEGGTLVGAVPAGFPGAISNLGSDNCAQYRSVYPLKGPDGVVGCTSLPYFADRSGTFVITDQCANPEAAMRVVNAAYTGEGRQRNHDGAEGIGWRWATEGEIGFNGKPAIWTSIRAYDGSIPQNSGFDQCGPLYCSADWRAGQTTDTTIDLWSKDGNEYMLYVVTEQGYDPVRDDSRAWPPLSLTVDENDTVAILRTEWDKFIQQSIYSFVSGEKDVADDAVWDAFLAEANACGIQEMLEIYTTAYERQYK